MKQGPNVKWLIVHKMSLIMIPPRTKNGLATGIAALSKPGNIGDVARQATEWVEAALAVVKAAPNNPYGDDDEAIAGEIRKGVQAREAALKQRTYRA